MNRKSLLTSALLAAGFVTVASAQTHIVYITGSTSFRSVVFSACTGTLVFDAAGTFLPSGASGSTQNIIYKGNIGGVPYEFVCGWSGSEAGVANVAGKTSLPNVKVPAMWNGNSAQTTGGTGPTDPFQNMPGVPYTFLDPNGDGTTFETSARTADLAFADTSRAASLTSDPSLTHEYGVIGVIPFVWEKAYSSAPSASWTHVQNVTIEQLIYTVANPINASFLTGNPADTDSILLVGRNKGSGTRVNTFVDVGTFPTAPNQWAAYSQYQGTSPNLQLKFVGTVHASVSAAAGANVVGNTPTGDGFDSGGGVAGNLGLDWANTSAVALGYVGMGDAATSEANGAVRLSLGGVTYSAGAVTLGTYPFFGYEHMYGQASPSADANAAQAKLASGINSFLISVFSAGDTTQGGIALSKMVASRPGKSDFGYPTQ